MSASQTVGDILKHTGRVLTISRDATALEAAKIMRDNRVGCLVVTSVTGRIDGILSERDIVRGVVATGGDPKSATVGHIMRSHVITCTLDTSVAEVHRTMTVHGIRHLPVLGAGRLAGMLSANDVLSSQLQAMREIIRRQSNLLGELEARNLPAAQAVRFRTPHTP